MPKRVYKDVFAARIAESVQIHLVHTRSIALVMAETKG